MRRGSGRVLRAATIVMTLTLAIAAARDEARSRTPPAAPRPEPTYKQAELEAVQREVETRFDELVRVGARPLLVGIAAGRHVLLGVEADGPAARRLLADLGDKVRVRHNMSIER